MSRANAPKRSRRTQTSGVALIMSDKKELHLRMRSIAIIPARGGSKRIPRKNIAPFGGRPAIARVIDAALASKVFETVVVSTDDDEIATVARRAGAQIVMRPPELSGDMTPMNPVILHAYEQMGADYDAIGLIFATAVFLTPELLRDASDRLAEDADLDYVLTLRRFETPPQRGLLCDEAGRVSMCDPSSLTTRTQDLTPIYRDAGMTTIGRTRAWLSGSHSFTARTFGLEVDALSAIDIDEPEDLAFAQALFEQRFSTRSTPRQSPPQTVILRADFFPGSGVGHVKRSNVLAKALANKGFRPILLLDAAARPMGFPFETSAAIRFLSADLDETADAAETVAIARADGASLVIRDSYRVGGIWEDDLTRAGMTVAAIDDLGDSKSAQLSITFTPGAKRPSNLEDTAHFLGGEAYMITDSPLLPARPRGRVLVHAGGTGGFDKVPAVIDAITQVTSKRDWDLTWLCPTPESASWLKTRNAIGKNDTVETWRSGAVWKDHDLIIGPASTSLYETIMQGALPVSFPISDTQGEPRDTWLNLGHALHIEAEEAKDQSFVERLLNFADEEHTPLRHLLTTYSKALDGKGADRVAQALADLMNGSPVPQPSNAPTTGTHIRPCTIADAERFRSARNAPLVRNVSTDPNHIIDWPEHLAWWLKTDAERFVIETDGQPEAYFWHRPRSHDGRNYMTAGWFPATDQPSLAATLRLLQWQHERTAQTHPDHIWVATIEATNKPGIALDKRMGFREAGPAAQAAAKAFWPGTDKRFLIFEKPAA